MTRKRNTRQIIQDAAGTDFDPNNCDATTSDNVQGAIEEVCNAAAVSASPGFTWGDSGNVVAGTWLINDTVPSNKTGRNFPLYNGVLFQISVANENVNTFDIEVYEHDGTTFTLLATVSIVAARSAVFDSGDFGSVSITRGKELAAQLSSGSAKNVVVQVIAKGTETP
jgi:hypothetical protein